VLAGRAKKLETLAEKASKKIVALQESLSTKDAEIEKL
jgi:hypothetical protein